MSYYENNFIEQDIENYNNSDNFYYLTENEQAVEGLDDNIYKEDTQDNYVEHMGHASITDGAQKQVQFSPAPQVPQIIVSVPTSVPTSIPKSVPKEVKRDVKSVKEVKKDNKVKKEAGLNWLYVLLLIVLISLGVYYLIDNKMITIPSFGSSASTASPSLSSSFKSTLGSTFMSLH